MANQNVARTVLWPTDTRILVRVVFLYVGQGSSAIVFVGNQSSYKVLLVDINLDRKNGGIDVPRVVKDLLEGQHLDAFVNTHPHDDHLRGVEALCDCVTIKEVWHSGHVPSKKYGACYKDLKNVIDKVKKAGGSETTLAGSRSVTALGDAEYYVLGPAEYLTDEVNDAQSEERYRRIHEQCAVLKFGQNQSWIMIPGDADRNAFEKHITEYHRERIRAFAIGASHHGSRTFFMMNEGDEPYLDGLKAIDPVYVVISAPTQEESDHGHPHDEAMKLYAEYVGQQNLLHTGAERYSYFFDIYRDGSHSGIQHDNGDISATYALVDDDGNDGGKAEGRGPFVSPKSQTGDLTPRRYG